VPDDLGRDVAQRPVGVLAHRPQQVERLGLRDPPGAHEQAGRQADSRVHRDRPAQLDSLLVLGDPAQRGGGVSGVRGGEQDLVGAERVDGGRVEVQRAERFVAQAEPAGQHAGNPGPDRDRGELGPALLGVEVGREHRRGRGDGGQARALAQGVLQVVQAAGQAVGGRRRRRPRQGHAGVPAARHGPPCELDHPVKDAQHGALGVQQADQLGRVEPRFRLDRTGAPQRVGPGPVRPHLAPAVPRVPARGSHAVGPIHPTRIPSSSG
jgi:hypothetical protein